MPTTSYMQLGMGNAIAHHPDKDTPERVAAGSGTRATGSTAMDPEALLIALDLAEPEWRESIYASTETELPHVLVEAALNADRPCAQWLIYRYEAGPPGRALPSLQQALEALTCDEAEVAHVYVLLMRASPLEPSVFVLQYLLACLRACQSTASAWFMRSLAERVALAAIAVGEPELAWWLLDGLSIDGEPHPQLRRVAMFAPLRSHPQLLADPLVRAIIVHFWPAMGFAAVPRLPWPPLANCGLTAAELHERLQAVGAAQVAELLESVVQRVGMQQLRSSAETSYQALRAQVQIVAASLGDPATCTEPLLRAALARIACPSADPGMLVHHLEAELSPLERVLEGMVLAAHLPAGVVESRWQLLDTTQQLLPTLSHGLLPMRIALLDELIDGATPEQAPFLLYQRANSRRGMAPLDPAALRLALEDLDAAVERADAVGQADIAVQVLALRGAVLAMLAEHDHAAQTRLAVELQQLRARMAATREPDALARLQLSLSSLERARGEAGTACEALEQAIAGLGDAPRFMCGLEVELITLRLANDQPQLALQRSEAAMNRYAADLDNSALAMLHIAHGRALAANGATGRARSEYEAALAAARGHELHWEIEARLLLAASTLVQGDLDEFSTQHEWLTQREDQLAPIHLHDLARLRSRAAARSGQHEHAAALLDEAITSAPNRATALELRLVRAGMRTRRGEPVEDLDALLLAAVAEGSHEGLSGAIEAEATAWLRVLRPHTRAALLEWCGESRPIFVARLHVACGEHERAQEILENSLATLTGMSRTICLHDLIVQTPDHQREVLARWCDELEAALEDHDEVHIRLDLASRLRILAGTEANGLTRALAHVERAKAQPLDADAERFADLQRLQILVNLVSTRSAQPTAELATLARMLLADSSVDAAELARARLHAALSMSTFGALVHADVIDAAEALLATVDDTFPGRLQVGARWAWIRSTHAGSLSAMPVALPSLPLDHVPQWLIAMFAGRDVSPSATQLTDSLDEFGQALTCRHDTADMIAARLMTLMPALEPNARRRLERVLIRAIEDPDNSSAWPDLHDAIAQLHARQPVLMRALAGALARRIGKEVDWTQLADDPPATDELEQLLSAARDASESARGLDAEANQQRLARARLGYEQALQRCRESGDVDGQAVALIGLGNIHRYASEPDFETALAYFDAADRLGPLHAERLAQLQKVQADALLGLGGAEQLRRAAELLDRALQVRTGRYRAETLLSAAEVAKEHPDLGEVERAQQAGELTMQAARVLATEQSRALLDAMFGPLVRCLADWQRLAPESTRPRQLLDELEAIYPQREEELHRAREGVVSGPTPETLDFVRLLGDVPGLYEFLSIVSLVQSLSSPTELERALQQLHDEPSTDAAVQAAASALLVLELAQRGQRTHEQARASTLEAMSITATLRPARAAALMLASLALHWVPVDHHDVFGDAGWALEIAELACQLDGGLDNAHDDVITALARAHRYMRTDDVRTHLELTRQLYERLTARARRDGHADTAALAVDRMAEVESELAYGDRKQRLQHLIARQQQALALAVSPAVKAELQARLAWYHTDLANHGFADDPIAELERSQQLFDGLDWDALPRGSREGTEHNRTVCAAGLAARRDGPRAEVAVWRARLEDARVQAKPYTRALAQHNLATALWTCPDLEHQEYREVVALAEASLTERTRVHARHHWETTLLLGSTYLMTFMGLRPASLRIEADEHDAWRAGIRWLEAALAAGLELGPGEELSDAALSLGALASWAPDASELERVAERAWSALRTALPYLLSEPKHRGRELDVAERLAFAVARLATTDLNRLGRHVAFVLEAERARAVIRWLRRAQAATQRPLSARLRVPPALPIATWRRWQQALDTGDGPELTRSLATIHECAPQYLLDELDLERTWEWLRARPDSAAISVHTRPPSMLCVILDHDADGRRRERVVVLDTPPFADERTLTRQLTKIVEGELRALAAHEQFVAWLREHLCATVEQLLGRTPPTLLWAPGPILRLFAPSTIWPNSAVASATGLSLPDIRRSPGRHRSTLLAAAMVRPDHAAAVGSVVAELAMAAEQNPELLVSLGRQFGRSAIPGLARVRECPMSADVLLAAAREHEVIVVLAHGFTDPSGAGGIVCVNSDGNEEILDVARMARALDAFTGATVILLACETGRVAGAMHQPGGVAGILLAAGARMVVAPLWPVELGVARDVALAVLDGLARGRAPLDALSALHAAGPHETEMQRRAYVCWIG